MVNKNKGDMKSYIIKRPTSLPLKSSQLQLILSDYADRLGGNKVINKHCKWTPLGLGWCMGGSAKVRTGMPREE